MAEYLARLTLARHGLVVGSAGTHAVPGRSMHPYAAGVLDGRGLDPHGFRSRAVTRDLLAGAGLVLTATRRERAYCASTAPGAIGRTFTLRQFARLATAADPTPPDVPGSAGVVGVPPTAGRVGVLPGTDLPTTGVGRLAAAVAAAVRTRSRLQPAGPEAEDLTDPIGGRPADFRRCAEEIEAAVLPIVALIAATG
ncbi:low molecular weight phosphatase family protein [Micromonospora echinofusca]|uniref:Low molecular weight phosphatase family protein n=2 Tax=Micromonospora echinofusca TaxID=47858 RepID=A0ABS3VX19_MICEH|nr:low molecular weight phosphatase family protein [Micromonospora echinofusca]